MSKNTNKNNKNTNKNNKEEFVFTPEIVMVNHKGEEVELTVDNIGSIYNTNYINSFLDKYDDIIEDEETTIDIHTASKYMIFNEYKLQSLQRKVERLKMKDEKDNVEQLLSSLSPEQVKELLAKQS